MHKIDIARAEDEDLRGIRDLWRLGFGETEEFLDFFFQHCYSRELTLVARDGGVAAASSQALPVSLWRRGRELPSEYIFGVVTHPGRRKLGYAGALMRAALAGQYQRGVHVSALIPAEPYLFDVYRKYGFTEAFSISEREVTARALKPAANDSGCVLRRFGKGDLPLDPETAEALYGFCASAYKSGRAADYSLIKGEGDFLSLAAAFLRFSGDIYAAYRDGRMTACAFVTGADGPFVYELLGGDEGGADFLIREILNITGRDRITVKGPPAGPGPAKALGMARVINARAVLKTLSEGRGLDIRVSVGDPIIRENNAVFRVRDGEAEPVAVAADLALTIQALTDFALGYDLDADAYLAGRPPLKGYMNLMLND